MNFKNMSKMEIYKLLKTNAEALQDARVRVSPKRMRDTPHYHTIKDALDLYNEIHEVKPHCNLYNFKELSEQEIIDLILSNNNALKTLRTIVAPSKVHRLNAEELKKYRAALEVHKKKNDIVRMYKKLK